MTLTASALAGGPPLFLLTAGLSHTIASTIAAAGAVAFAATLLVTLLARFDLVLRLRRPSRPGRQRGEEQPRVGGLAVLCGFSAAILLVSGFSHTAEQLLAPHWRPLGMLTLAGLVVFGVGLWDDARELGYLPKLLALLLGAGLVFAAGFRFGELPMPWGAWRLGLLDGPLTVLWLLLLANAINLIDGKDGVATGIAFFASGSLAIIAFDLRHPLVSLLYAALAGAALGFLPFNLPTARRYLGDSGALLLGFLIGALSLAGFIDGTGRIPATLPAIALGFPILETILALARRLLDLRHPFHYDRDHIHDRLERAGLGPVALVVATYVGGGAFAAAALAVHFARNTLWASLSFTAVVAAAIAALVWLGYATTLWESRLLSLVRRRLGLPRASRPAGR